MKPYLFVVPSSCQMYSGTGTAIFDWIKFAKNIFQFSFLMDTTHEVNVEVTRRFCEKHGIDFISSAAFSLPGCPDPGIKRVAEILQRREFEFVECVSWANAATNLQVLASIDEQTHLVYTPHSQPLWTLGQPTRFPMVLPAFRKMVERANTLMLDSPVEQEMELFHGAHIRRPVNARLGVDTDIYRFDGDKPRASNTILTVFDFREKRKRFDCVLAGFEIARQREPSLRLIIAGKNSDVVPLPPHLEPYIERMGYITLEQLVNLYQTSGQFCLLSDYEAFGLPIAEALCCGLPVTINAQKEIVAIFANLPGVSTVQNTDAEAVADNLLRNFEARVSNSHIAAISRQHFALATAYKLKLDHVLN